MTENELATIAVDISFKIHKTLRPGLLESVYESAFAYELTKRGIAFTRQQGIVANYEDEILDVGFRADIIMENKLIVELKSVERLEKVHHKTVLTYLRLAKMKLGLLINFNVELIKEGIHRKILGQLT
ncbi:MAG: GxxExxY protein [Chitinophagaceae bacterium]|nr:GxxExxY protein [Chitinophagaceae bacterium]